MIIGWLPENTAPEDELQWDEWLAEEDEGEERAHSRDSSEERSPKRRRAPGEDPLNVPVESYKKGPAEHIESVSSIFQKIKIHSFSSQGKGGSKKSKKGSKKSKSSKGKGVVKRRKHKHRTKEKVGSD
ncbi:uncharacterized protein N7483_009420 [Penicillium malachiteum]|uniref:uncharacterized protein n=1 Tax=Penicillium malachiteum TaxID=1324776 RepID=UPI00254956AF|nr:uncharacterized protein N7483_009420 [Penicillium malachiteum]KAJ5721486.1 hypothetical protein N7483_009420 [Penicillium malachiteum]